MSLGNYREGVDSTGAMAAQNAYNFKPEWSRLLYDRPHVLSIIASYDLPFGNGRRYLRSSPKPVRILASGWTFSSLHQYESGNLIQVAVPNALGNGVLYSLRTRPNVTGQPFRTGISRTDLDPNNPKSQWINPGSLAVPAPFTFGNAANFYSSLRNPTVLTENMALLKRTAIRETVNLEYRLEVSNPFNRTEFGNVQSSLTAANFGRPTGASYNPRVIQMALRLNF
jgi:hypothetical protein